MPTTERLNFVRLVGDIRDLLGSSRAAHIQRIREAQEPETQAGDILYEIAVKALRKQNLSQKAATRSASYFFDCDVLRSYGFNEYQEAKKLLEEAST